MADFSDLPDLLQEAAAFRAAYAALLALKQNANAALDEDDAALRAVAEWGNWVDGNLVVLQSDLADRRVGAILRLGDATVHYVTTPPEGSLTAPVGDYAFVDDGTVWAKTSGSGNTGWTEVGASGSASDPVLFRSATEVDTGAGGSDAEIDFVNVTIPADTLDVDGRKLIIEQIGDWLNTGSAREFQWRLYLGGVLVLSDQVTFNASTSSRRPFELTTTIVSLGQTSQRTQVKLWAATLNPTAPTTGLHGQLDGLAFMGGPVRGNNAAADRTASMALRITIQLSAATSAFRLRQQAYTVRVE